MNLSDPKFVWVPSHKTDVMATWIKHGYKPLKSIDKQTQEVDNVDKNNGAPEEARPRIQRARRSTTT